MPLDGGALYMIGRVTTVFAQTFSPRGSRLRRTKALRWMRIPLMILLLLLSLCLVVLYPMSFGSTQMWLIFSVVLSMQLRDSLSMQLRDSLCQRMGRLCLDGRMEQTTFLCLSGGAAWVHDGAASPDSGGQPAGAALRADDDRVPSVRDGGVLLDIRGV